MRSADVDAYIDAQPEPKRTTLQATRATIHEIVPQAQEIISHGVPMFTLNGKKFAGIAAFHKHLVYAPQSSTVLVQCADVLGGYVVSKASLQFPIDIPLPRVVLERLIAVRIAELG
ncbi:MAG: hypothetical protein RLY87_157 [Chloroflexota bacterium]